MDSSSNMAGTSESGLFIVNNADNRATPKVTDKVLVVCAGTVTLKKVADMGLGFSLFKRLFASYPHWQDDHDDRLDRYHRGKDVMPAFVEVNPQFAEDKHQLIGGIATVPARSQGFHLHSNTQHNFYSDELLEGQYQAAVEAALLAAQKYNVPLFIQPLGIGEYGWDPLVAARLFHAAIQKIDPLHQLKITVPLFNTIPDSSDQQFGKRLQVLYNMSAPVVASVSGLPPIPEAQYALLAKQAQPQSHDSRTESSKLHSLKALVDVLIIGIETRAGKNTTSEIAKRKLALLSEMSKLLGESPVELTAAIKAVSDICKIRRHPFHFWGKTKSTQAFSKLLHLNQLDQVDVKPSVATSSL